MLTSPRKASLRLCLRGDATGATYRVVGPTGEDEPQEGIPSLPRRSGPETYESSRRNDGTSRMSCDTSKPDSEDEVVAGTGRSTDGASRRRRRRLCPPKPVAITVT